MIQLVIACDSKNGIAKNGVLPWPKNVMDLKRFKFLTLKTIVVMGKNTWDAVDMPSPLPNRENIVVTSSDDDTISKYSMTIEDVKDFLDTIPKNKIVSIIGGAKLVSTLIDYVDTIYLTQFHYDYDCDVFLDDNIFDNFEQISSIRSDSYSSFKILKKYE